MNRPFLLYQIEVLRAAGIEDISLALSYQPDKIEHLFGKGTEYGVNLRFLTEPSPLGTAGAYRFASQEVRDTMLVLNGDILTNANLKKLIDHHEANSAEATIALAPVHEASSFGLVETDASSRVRMFIEKPATAEISKKEANTINAGIYILEPSVHDLIPKGENRSFEYHVFPDLLEQKRAFFGYTLLDEYWRDLGTPESYLEAHLDFLAGKIRGFSFEEPGPSDIATAAVVDSRSVIGEGSVIKPNARIANSVLGPGLHVEERAVIENSVIWSHTRVSGFAEITRSVIARSCHIGRNVRVDAGTVLGDKASIPDYSRI
jgi:NDP-sugar pyrophosphorylase family protein